MRGRSPCLGRCLLVTDRLYLVICDRNGAEPALRCEILKGMGATSYGSLVEYDGATFLKSWEEKSEGEIGTLVKYPVNE